MKLERRQIEKPWGRTDLPPMFANPDGLKIGEIWFEAPDGRDLPLLIKYIFTSERLSVQVHPDDLQAQARGLPRGKTECWYILDREEGATLGLGFKKEVEAEALRSAALDGSIEQMMDWKPVQPGDFYFVPASTVHAIGAGIALVEVQQTSDTTYRLYDYGRPRELHLEDGIAVSKAVPYPDQLARQLSQDAVQLLVSSDHFSVLRIEWTGSVDPSWLRRDSMVIPLEGELLVADEVGRPGDCFLLPADMTISSAGRSSFLLAFSGRMAEEGKAN